jgi:hypothetical protein
VHTWGTPAPDGMVGYPPPALAVVRGLLKMARAATQPVWVSAACTRRYEVGKTYEVKVNNFPATEDFPGHADAVTWGDHQGTVKQWAVFRVMPNEGNSDTSGRVLGQSMRVLREGDDPCRKAASRSSRRRWRRTGAR